MFYCPNHSMRIVETGNVRFIENDEISGSTVPREVAIKEVRVQVLLAYASSSNVIAPLVIVTNNNEEAQHNNEPIIHNEPIVEEPYEVALMRPQREMRLAISIDYVAYLHETKTNLSINNNYPISFSPVSRNDSFRIIMTLVAYYDLELHQMDVKITFLNGDLEENAYMDQPMGF